MAQARISLFLSPFLSFCEEVNDREKRDWEAKKKREVASKQEKAWFHWEADRDPDHIWNKKKFVKLKK
jgi:hypothetical protein